MKALCKEKLNDEYYHLSVELAAKIARKRISPLLSGPPKTWAAGIIQSIVPTYNPIGPHRARTEHRGKAATDRIRASRE